MSVILVNAVTIAFEHVVIIRDYFDLVYLSIYLLEFIFKFFVERKMYWKNTYNRFDFALLLLSVVQLAFQTLLPYMNLTYLRVFRGSNNLKLFHLFD